MGRSSASCDYQFSSNRLISRVHVSTCFKPAGSRLERDRIEVTCSGWNGIKIHCQGKVYDLKKGETFASDIRDAEVMIDVQDNRVVVKWPEKPLLGPMSSDEEEESPAKKQRAMRRHSTPPSPSPLQSRRRPVSPISPSPAVQALLPSSPPVHPARAPADTVQIYEDPEPTQGIAREDESVEISQATQILSQNVHSTQSPSQSNLFSPKDEFSDNDEENDPIVHSFGPFGANLLPRMASFNATGSPRASSTKTSRSSHTEPLHPNDSPAQPTSQPVEFDIRGHIINQLAFSRLSSTPLSTIFNHLPRDAGVVTKTDLKNFINETQCIGEVVREGKDAAGKPLESEYYYIPDQDEDEKRKEAVVTDLMKPGLRACRKQHKVRCKFLTLLLHYNLLHSWLLAIFLA